MSQPDDLEGGFTAEQVKAIFDERAAVMDLVEALVDDAPDERIEDLLNRYEEAAQVRRELGLTDHQLESSEPIRTDAMAGERPVKALLIPADPSRPVQMIEISGRDDLRVHVGGISEATQYDYDAIMYVSDTGRLDGQPMNVRATEYIRTESEAAKQGRMIGIDPSYGLYGNVVAVGGSGDGLRDVPDRLLARFATPEREQPKTTVSTDDLRQVVNMARDIEDVAPEEQSALDRIRQTIRERNEDGMIRIPWFKARLEIEKSPSPNWTAEKVDGTTVYYRTQGEAVVWKDSGRWMMDFAVDPQSPTVHADLGRTRSVDKALNRADLTIMSAQVEVHQSYEDVRTVVNLAKEVDRTPEEQGAIDRLQEAIDQGPPPGALDPAEDWLKTFEAETHEREHRDQDQDRGY